MKELQVEHNSLQRDHYLQENGAIIGALETYQNSSNYSHEILKPYFEEFSEKYDCLIEVSILDYKSGLIAKVSSPSMY